MKKSNPIIHRRDAIVLAAACSALPMLGCTSDKKQNQTADEKAGQATQTASNNQPKSKTENKVTDNHSNKSPKENKMKCQFLEIVTTEVDAVCQLHSEIHGVTFGDPEQALGGARTTKLADGGVLSVRAPMHEGENPATRPYMLVEDLDAAVAAVKKAGAEILVPAMEIPGHGTIALYKIGGNEAGLWKA